MQNSYSQNREDLFIADYFGDFKGTLLDIGANDGVMFSNSRLLIEKGWNGHLLEPGISAFLKLAELYADSWHTTLHRIGIGSTDGVVRFYESGAHVKDGVDRGLVSTIDYAETERWRNSGVEYGEIEIRLLTWATFYERCNGEKFDFVSIDAEGLDWQILKQMDLDALGCRCLCIEWNSDPKLFKLFTDYCKGFKIGLMNAENLVLVK